MHHPSFYPLLIIVSQILNGNLPTLQSQQVRAQDQKFQKIGGKGSQGPETRAQLRNSAKAKSKNKPSQIGRTQLFVKQGKANASAIHQLSII